MKKTSKFFTTIATFAMALGIFALSTSVVKAAGKEMDVNKLDEVSYTSEVTVGDFTYVATDSKKISVATLEEAVTATDGKTFSKEMSFGGGANQIKFKASKGDKVVVYVRSTGTDDREVGLFSTATITAEGKNTALTTGVIPSKEVPVGVVNFEVPEDGEYYIATVTKGMRIYYLSVGDVAAKQDPVPKTGVVSVAAICGVVALASAGVAVATRKKED